MKETKAIICPSCRKLIGGHNQTCPFCGFKRPVQAAKVMSLLGGKTNSFVRVIIGINIVFFIVSYLLLFILPGQQVVQSRGLLGFLPSPSSLSLYLLGWADPRDIINGSWWRLITAMFLHGGILHIVFNMMWVKDLGPTTENLFSPHKMVIIYLLAGFFGNATAIFTPILLNGFLGTHLAVAPVVGASGAVFGLIGAVIAFGKKRGGMYGQHLVRQLGVWAAILIVMGFIIPGVSNAAHIGGFISGFIVGYLLPLRKKAGLESFFMLTAIGLILVTAFSTLMMIINLFQVLQSI